MSDRGDLIDLIDGATWSLIDSDVVADAILAAGWRAPERLMAAGWMSPGEQLLGRPYEPTEPMRTTIATVLLNESSHRDEYYGKDLPGCWFGYVYEWDQVQRNPDDWSER